MWLGLATGIALVVAGVVVHEPVLLGLGAVGVFGHTVRLLADLFAEPRRCRSPCSSSARPCS